VPSLRAFVVHFCVSGALMGCAAAPPQSKPVAAAASTSEPRARPPATSPPVIAPLEAESEPAPEAGLVGPGWLGVELAKREGAEAGVLVRSVMRHSPAARAGIEAGDIVVSIDGESVAKTTCSAGASWANAHRILARSPACRAASPRA
jgi:S1-C subfamily serine protease